MPIDLKKMKDSVGSVVDGAVEKAKVVKVPEINVDAIKQQGVKTKDQIVNAFKRSEKVDDIQEEEPQVVVLKEISVQNALKIFYYIMVVDGDIHQFEEDVFDSIGYELDNNFDDNKETIINQCKVQIDKALEEEDRYDVIQEGIADALIEASDNDEDTINTTLLLWDLLTLAYSDERYGEIERKLIKFIVRKTNFDKAMFLELESSYSTLIDIEKEIKWIKTTNRPYLTIEAMVNELIKRKEVIVKSVNELVII